MLTLHEAPRGGSSCPSPPSTGSSSTGSSSTAGSARPADVVSELAGLLAEAGTRDLDDRGAWRRLTAEARAIVARLVALGAVPAHLQLRDGEPAVVVRRTIAAAWRYASGAATAE